MGQHLPGTAPFWGSTILGPTSLFRSVMIKQHKGSSRAGEGTRSGMNSSLRVDPVKRDLPKEPQISHFQEGPEEQPAVIAQVKSRTPHARGGKFTHKKCPPKPRQCPPHPVWINAEPGLLISFPLQSLSHTLLPPSFIYSFISINNGGKMCPFPHQAWSWPMKLGDL